MDLDWTTIVLTSLGSLFAGVNIIALYQMRATKKNLEAQTNKLKVETDQVAMTHADKAMKIAKELNEDLRVELDRLQDKVGNLEKGRRTDSERIGILEAKIREDAGIISGLKESIASLTKENRTLRESLSAMSDERHAILERLESTEAQYTGLEAQYTKLEKENVTLRRQVAELRKKQKASE